MHKPDFLVIFFDPELFPQNAYVKVFATLAIKYSEENYN